MLKKKSLVNRIPRWMHPGPFQISGAFLSGHFSRFFSYSLDLSQRRSCWLVIQSCLIWHPMDCSPPGSSVHGISQAKILEQAISSSRGSSSSRESVPAQVLNLYLLHWQAGSLHWATMEAMENSKMEVFFFLSEGKKNSLIRWQKSQY